MQNGKNWYVYANANPINYIDPSGYVPTCPISSNGHSWDCNAVLNVFNLKSSFLDSARRHNRIPGMDTNGFAALLASTMIGERHLGNQNPADGFLTGVAEILAVELGCVSSGHLIVDALRHHNWSQFFGLLANNPDVNSENIHIDELVGFASVGIGNIKLKTAADLWNGQTCRFDGACTPVKVSDLQYNDWGTSSQIQNPFDSRIICSHHVNGVCQTYIPTKVQSYQMIANQLLDSRINIEYLAVNFEAAALRAISLGEAPTAFNTVAWHTKGVQTDDEIRLLQRNITISPQSLGHANWVLDDVTISLQVLGLTSTWNKYNEPQYNNHP
jgi:hypothetical protein